MRVDLGDVEPMGSPAQRAAAQTIVALAVVDGDQLDDPLEVAVSDGPMRVDGTILIHGQLVDVADALRAGATVFATALSCLPAPRAVQLARRVGIVVSWGEVLEEGAA